MNIYFCIEILLVLTLFGYLIWKLIQDNSSLAKEKEGIDDSLSTEEKKVRRNWYLAFLLFYGFSFVGNASNRYFSGNGVGVDGTIASILIFFPSIVATYYFSYLKSGTKWIGTYLCISLASIVLIVPAFFLVPAALPVLREMKAHLLTVEMSFMTYTLISLPFSIYFLVQCKRLYDLNSKIKKRKSSQPAS